VSHTQRATILFLIMAVVGVWGLGLRAALRTSARANQEVISTPVTREAPAEIAPTPEQLPTVTPSPSPTAASPTPSASAPQGPGGTPSPSPIPPSPTSPRRAATATPRLPTPTPSPNPPTLSPQRSTASAPDDLRRNSSPSPSPSRLPSPDKPPDTPRAQRFLLINQDEQTMTVYEDGVQIRSIPISSGRPVRNAYTPAWRGVVGDYLGGGRFRNRDEWSDYMWYLFPGAQGAILIHSVPYLWAGDV